MTDPLAGMTREQARAFMQRMRESAYGSPYTTVLAMDMVRLLALAALGAECVGAEEVAVMPHCARVTVDTSSVARRHVATFDTPCRVLVLKEDR